MVRALRWTLRWNNSGSMSFSVVSYNVLATAYIQRAWYPRTPALVLNPAWRVPALAQYIAKLDADLFCLQEVEPESFVALRTFLSDKGYAGEFARKLAGRPDGLAIFYRRGIFEWLGARVVAYADGGGFAHDSGYIAQLARLRHGEKILGVINTHLTWDPPNSARELQRGLRQIQQCVAEYRLTAAETDGWIVSGDFNVAPEGEPVSLLRQAGFDFAHRELAATATCNMGGSARMIDYLFHSATLSAAPTAPRRIDDRTILPSGEEPSDHLPILARFDWRD